MNTNLTAVNTLSLQPWNIFSAFDSAGKRASILSDCTLHIEEGCNVEEAAMRMAAEVLCVTHAMHIPATTEFSFLVVRANEKSVSIEADGGVKSDQGVDTEVVGFMKRIAHYMQEPGSTVMLLRDRVAKLEAEIDSLIGRA